MSETNSHQISTNQCELVPENYVIGRNRNSANLITRPLVAVVVVSPVCVPIVAAAARPLLPHGPGF